MKSYIGKRGYIIYKSTIKEEELEKIKKELTVQPYVNQEYGEPIKPFPIFLENSEMLEALLVGSMLDYRMQKSSM